MLKSRKILKLISRNVAQARAVEKTLTNRMKAWQIHSYGDLSELQLTQARVPVIQSPDDVLVRVEAASVNPIDKMIIGGYGKELLGFLRNYELEFPLTLGRDFAGKIIDKGHGVGDEFNVGDSVFGILAPHKQGSFAEAVLCDKESICHCPRNIPELELSSIAYAAMTAWSALFLTGELIIRSPRHSKILILGASGGVGTVAVQILKSQDAIVVGTCSSDAVPLVKSLGATHVFDYTDEGYVQSVSNVGPYDVILDCAKFGYQNIPPSWDYRRFVTLNSPLLVNTDAYGLCGGLVLSARDLLTSNFPKVIGGKTVRWGFVSSRNEGMKFITRLIEKQQICPVIHKVFKFEDVPAAFETMSKGHLRGKIVIDFN